MALQVNSISELYPSEQHMVRGIDYAKQQLKDNIDDVNENLKIDATCVITGIAGSVFGGYLSRTAYSGINVIATHTAVVVVGSRLAKNAVVNGLQTVENYVYKNPMPSVFAMSGIIGSVFFGCVACAAKPPRADLPHISILKPNVIAVLSFSSGLLTFLSTGLALSIFQGITALAPKISSEINGLTQSVLDDAYDNPTTSVARVVVGIAGLVLGRYQNKLPFSFPAPAVGLGAFLATPSIIQLATETYQSATNGWLKYPIIGIGVPYLAKKIFNTEVDPENWTG